MEDLVKEIEKVHMVHKTTGASARLIQEAETKLKLKFADDYKQYLSLYGALSFGPTELTGLNVGAYANVVDVTLSEMKRDQSFPKNSIVLENIGLEGLLILQKKDGVVYEWMDGKIGKTFANLKTYIESLLSDFAS